MTIEHIKSVKSNKVTLTSKDSYKGISTRSGVAGGSNGTLTYNVQWKTPKQQPRRQSKN